MQTFYPAIKTYADHRLEVNDVHTLYIEECGNPRGLPVLVVHGGPGAGCEPYQRRFFDPEVYRIILFDQRGAGKSRPHAELKNNKTQDLIEDIEKIRDYLKIDKWLLFGGSWGATLSLLYAQNYADKVVGLILHNIFLGRHREINWFYQEGANQIFPDYWRDFTHSFNEKEQENLIQAYHERLTGNDELARMSAAKSWSLWQARCTALQPHSDIIDHFSDPHFAVSLASIESYYLANNCFLAANHTIENMDKLQQIPGYIVHGRYDMVCPLKGAWELQQSWPQAELYIVRDAGHSPREPGIIDALIIATKKMAKNYQGTAC